MILPRSLFRRNPLSRQVATVASGAGGAQLVMIVTTPIIARLYGPEAFGVLAMLLAVSQFAVPLASLRYVQAIMLPDSDRESRSLLWVSNAFGAMTALACGAILVIAAFSIPSVLPKALTGPVPQVLLPLVIFLGAYRLAWTHWEVRLQQHSLTARARVAQAIGTAVVQIGVGVFAPTPTTLLVGEAAGLLAAICILRILRSSTKPRVRRGDLGEVWSLVKSYRAFPLVNSWGNSINSLSIQLTPVLLGASFGAAAAGDYLMAYRVCYSPMKLVGASYGTVYYREAQCARTRPSDLSLLTARGALGLLGVGLAAAIAVGIAGPAVFETMFGSEWTRAGQIARIVAPSLVLTLIASNMGTLLLVQGRQVLLLGIQIMLLAACVGPLWGLPWVGASLFETIAFYSMSQSIAYGVYVSQILRAAGCSIAQLRAVLVETIRGMGGHSSLASDHESGTKDPQQEGPVDHLDSPKLATRIDA